MQKWHLMPREHGENRHYTIPLSSIQNALLVFGNVNFEPGTGPETPVSRMVIPGNLKDLPCQEEAKAGMLTYAPLEDMLLAFVGNTDTVVKIGDDQTLSGFFSHRMPIVVTCSPCWMELSTRL